MRLEKGDIILTGTPEGVSSVKPNQMLTCLLKDEDQLISQVEFRTISRTLK